MRKRRIASLVCILSLMMINPAWSNLSKKDILGKFVSAEHYYKSGDLGKAIEDYEAIIASGRVSGNVYFNLANSYIKNKQLGKAMLNYERALRIIPRDGDLKFNYRFAKARIKDNTKVSLNLYQRALKAHVQFYTKEEMFTIMTCILIVMSLMYLIAEFLKWKSSTRKWAFTAFAVIFCVFLFGFIMKINGDSNLAYVIIKDEARFEPRKNSTIHFPLPEGVGLKILKKEDDWFKIKRIDSKSGWVRQKSVERF